MTERFHFGRQRHPYLHLRRDEAYAGIVLYRQAFKMRIRNHDHRQPQSEKLQRIQAV